MDKKNLGTMIIVLGIIILAYSILNKGGSDISEELARCIADNSVLYVQLGCHSCETQKKMFENNYKYLNVTDCFLERDKCQEIEATPTWEINNKKYKGVQSIEELKELTGC